MIQISARLTGARRVLGACLTGLSLLVAAPAASAPAASAPAARAAVSRNGLLWLDIQPPDAEVSLDGGYLDAGVWLISLAPGPHAIFIYKAGFHAWGTQVEIAAGKSLSLDPRLEPVLDPPLAPLLGPPLAPQLTPLPAPLLEPLPDQPLPIPAP